MTKLPGSAHAIFNRINGQHRDMPRWQGAGNPVRAADFELFDAAGFYLTNAEQLDP